jgi:hypothetical protein
MNFFLVPNFKKKNILIKFFDLVYVVIVSNIYIYMLALPIQEMLCCVIG